MIEILPCVDDPDIVFQVIGKHLVYYSGENNSVKVSFVSESGEHEFRVDILCSDALVGVVSVFSYISIVLISIFSLFFASLKEL